MVKLFCINLFISLFVIVVNSKPSHKVDYQYVMDRIKTGVKHVEKIPSKISEKFPDPHYEELTISVGETPKPKPIYTTTTTTTTKKPKIKKQKLESCDVAIDPDYQFFIVRIASNGKEKSYNIIPLDSNKIAITHLTSDKTKGYLKKIKHHLLKKDETVNLNLSPDMISLIPDISKDDMFILIMILKLDDSKKPKIIAKVVDNVVLKKPKL